MIRTQLHHLLEGHASARPDAPALSFHDATLSYEQVWRSAHAVAGRLCALGVRRGDRVAIYLEKRIELVVAIFATSIAGAVFVPINHVFKSLQVGHILADSGATVLVTSIDRLAQVSAALALTDVHDVVVVGDTRAEVFDGFTVHQWSEATDGTALPAETASIDTDPAAILYTSGSTGRPKGVVLSHRNLIVGAESVSTYLRNSGDDVILSVLPLSFDAGLSQVTTAFAVGAHLSLIHI